MTVSPSGDARSVPPLHFAHQAFHVELMMQTMETMKKNVRSGIVDVVLPRSDDDHGEIGGWARVREQPNGLLVDVRLRCLVEDPDDFKTCSADNVRVVE